MNNRSSMERSVSVKFCWTKFRELFPFGDLNMREGAYIQLVEAVLDQLEGVEQKNLLLDLLDTQYRVYLEQLHILNEQYENEDPFVGEIHFAGARLQINFIIRDGIGAGH